MIQPQDIYLPLYDDTEHFIILITGGRGSGKSYNAGTFIERLTFEAGHVILYCRYTMVSAAMSVIPEFTEKIEADGTGEFFHGPFEVTDANTPFVIQISEGTTRALDERCLKFLHTYAKRIEVLDAKELGLSTIDASVVDYFNHSLFNNVYPIYNHALAEARQHPLTTRRYMWKVEY